MRKTLFHPSPRSPLCSGFLTLHAKLHLLCVHFLKPSGKSIVAFLFHNFSLLLIILYTYLQKVSLVHLTKLSIILLLLKLIFKGLNPFLLLFLETHLVQGLVSLLVMLHSQASLHIFKVICGYYVLTCIPHMKKVRRLTTFFS